MVPGSAASILRSLEQFGFEWDGAVVYQSARTELYEDALAGLHSRALTFECSCSRSELAEELRYPGYCRERPLHAGLATATRLRVDAGSLQFSDRIQGMFRQNVADAVGDFILRRRDRVFAYVLAVVVDDAAQGVTHVLRGADLLDNTPRQIYLQKLLGLSTPSYAHVPVLTDAGKKLAKSSRRVRLDPASTVPQLVAVFDLLGLSPPGHLGQGSVGDVWNWAIQEWDVKRVPRRLALPLVG
jgi:glutamyl-Q tRNA(Asp) synthetase